jgi:hypothetical protein
MKEVSLNMIFEEILHRLPEIKTLKVPQFLLHNATNVKLW